MTSKKEKRAREAWRKSIHLSSLIMPLAYRYLFHYNKSLMFWILLLLTIIALVIEMMRLERPTFKRIFLKLFNLILRRHEHRDFTGATYMMVAGVLCVAFLEPQIAFCALSFLSIGDTFAAIIGMSMGKRKLPNSKKSLEGALACFVSTFAWALAFGTNPWISFVGAVATTFAELSALPVDDNIKIPIVSGIAMAIVSIFV